ncbi:MAG: sensor histidine kinase [Gemmatimonadaceae bacterium]
MPTENATPANRPSRDQPGAPPHAAPGRGSTDDIRVGSPADGAWLRAAFEQAAIGIAYQTVRQEWLSVNQRFCDIVGYTRSDLMQLRLSDLAHPDDRAAAEEFNARTCCGELSEYSIEQRLIRGDGSVIWVHFTVNVVRSETGSATSFISFLEDITARHGVEQSLAESEARYRGLAEATLEGVFIHDRGVVIDANPSLLRMIGIDASGLIGLNAIDTLPAPEWRDFVRRQVAEGNENPYEITALRKDGTRVPVEIQARNISHNGRRVRVAAVRDMTERKRLEEQAAQLIREQAARAEAELAEARAAFLAEASRELGASFDYETTLRRVSQLVVPRLADGCALDVAQEGGAFLRLGSTHVDPAREPLLRELSRFSPGDVTPDHPVMRVLHDGSSVLIPEVSGDLLDGWIINESQRAAVRSLDPHSLISVPLAASGRVLGVLTLFVTDSGRHFGPDDLALAEELGRRAALAVENARLYEEARHATSARDDMLGVVAHDLRNPLSTVLMGTELLLEGMQQGEHEQERSQLEIVQRAADRMNRLIQDLLDVKRIESGRLSMERRSVAFESVVREAAEMLRPIATAASLRLDTELPDDLPSISADPLRIQQVLSNLVGNAIKFTPAGGRIAIRVEEKDTEILCSVTDTGPGIAPDAIPHIFGRFWQGNVTDRRGIGLGLAISKGIIEAHRGRIWVESTLGAGTTFMFSLPFRIPTTAEYAVMTATTAGREISGQ